MHLAFIRSLVAWQRAVAFSASFKQPIALITWIDLVGAAEDVEPALEWVCFLRQVSEGTTSSLQEAEARATSEDVADVVNGRNMLEAIREALRHAEEHAAEIRKATSGELSKSRAHGRAGPRR
jgi:hypothetical protein